MDTRKQQIEDLQAQWAGDPRWAGVERPYTAADVVRLRGSLQPQHTLAARGAGPIAANATTAPLR